MFDEAGDCFGGGDFMFVSDFFHAVVERSAEDTREGSGVIDLVGEIASSGSDDGCAGFFGDVWHDFWRWV